MSAGNLTAVEVLLPLPFAGGFDYAVPEGMVLAPGAIVTVPFGRKQVTGVVWGAATGEVPVSKLKPVKEHHAHLSGLKPSLRQFIDWVAWYTYSPCGLVLKMALPVPEAIPLPKRESKTEEEIAPQLPKPFPLSPIQAEIATLLKTKLGAGFSVSVLDGVTGSGKTEVYFDAIAEVLKAGGQALVLLPEIALSVQWLARFERRFGFAPAVWHSDVPKAKKKKTWCEIMRGQVPVVVGARSALFLPYQNLSLVVVDEEHEPSYKQEDGVLYHARDMAVARAKEEQIPLLLVSATPSLETENNITQGKFTRLHLPHRHGGVQFPRVELIDMRSNKPEQGGFLSPPLRQALVQALGKGHQAMLFLNRRGYAPLVLCRACGYRFQCPNCATWLVSHKGKGIKHQALEENSNLFNAQSLMPKAYLQCHHCNYRSSMPSICPACGEQDCLHAIGPGVERLQEEVVSFLPDARIALMTSDHTGTVDEMQQAIEKIEKKEVDIVIGTQMIAKGHHFPSLAFVGVVDADLGLAGGDLRAAERTYQLLHQLSGRAGREEIPGHVYIQSYLPEHPVMQALIAGERDTFMELEMRAREQSIMPPFGRLVALIVEGPRNLVEPYARTLAHGAPNLKEVRVLGPAPAPIALLRGKYRMRLLVKATRSVSVQSMLRGWLTPLPPPSSVRLKVDIDPYSFL